MLDRGAEVGGGRRHVAMGATGGRRPTWWHLVMSCLLALVLAGFVVAMVLPTIDRQHQYATLRSRGVTTAARIDYCVTAESSAPASATVTCPGTFTVHSIPVTQDILGLPAPLQAGATLTVMADPRDTRDVYPVADVRTGYQSGWRKDDSYYALLALGLLVLTAANVVIVIRRRHSA
jgi:hypothetical protein